MLELRPSCEHCDRDLPPASHHAMICSFECTFCADCATGLLAYTCPNCGGGFTARPIRPAHDLKNGNHLGAYPASMQRKHRPVDVAAHAGFVAALRDAVPHK